MEVRSYYSTTVEAAMDLARRELGPDAMLVQSRRTPPELEHMGRYEVVFAGEPRPHTRRVTPREATPREAAATIRMSSPFETLSDIGPVDLLSKRTFAAEFEAATRQVPEPRPAISKSKREPETRSAALMAPADQLAAGLLCNPGLGRANNPNPSVLLAGSSGAGKTLTTIKLAAQFGMLASRAIRLIAFDPDRICSTARLRQFALLSGATFFEAETIGSLSAALLNPFPGLTLIDTASATRNSALLELLAACLRTHPSVETQLVLRTDRVLAANLASIDTYAELNPSKLILTALDETPELVSVPELIRHAALPVSFLCSGQRVPEDLEPAAGQRLADLIVSAPSRAARAAA